MPKLRSGADTDPIQPHDDELQSWLNPDGKPNETGDKKAPKTPRNVWKRKKKVDDDNSNNKNKKIPNDGKKKENSVEIINDKDKTGLIPKKANAAKGNKNKNGGNAKKGNAAKAAKNKGGGGESEWDKVCNVLQKLIESNNDNQERLISQLPTLLSVPGDGQKLLKPLFEKVDHLIKANLDIESSLVECASAREFGDLQNSESAFRRSLEHCKTNGFCSKFHDQLTLSGYGDIRPQKVNMQIYNAGQRNAKKRKLNDSSQRVVSGECRFGANCNRKANCRFTHPQAQAKPVPMKVDENAD
eukprot:856643_1